MFFFLDEPYLLQIVLPGLAELAECELGPVLLQTMREMESSCIG